MPSHAPSPSHFYEGIYPVGVETELEDEGLELVCYLDRKLKHDNLSVNPKE
jgi:hypothetical protein